ncbi:amino acid ABC transporter permease [Streptomyces sp. JJ36]|uniref:amino acid ABC transporter permease n=1 Tax=Streptomyces sp. JJ36 TaxID=2736645 RepID=UPI001F2D5865|nr:amino acid ABC transporter permease [Streptomyces sp. JJ36]
MSQDGGPGAAPATKARPEAIKAVPVRHYGRWIGAAVVLGLLALLVLAFANADIDWGVVGSRLFDEAFLSGTWNTLWVTVLAMLLGVVLGMVLAVMRMSANPVLSGVAWLYIWFFRGTPVLVQIFLWFNLSIIFETIDLGPIYKNEMNDVMTPFVAALLGLGLNEAAYMAEISRAGIQSVDTGQTEAAQALGMPGSKTMRRIVLPQAMRVIIPPTGNEFINMLKTSSLAYAIGFNELFLASRNFGSRTLAVMEALLMATVWYLVLTTVFSIFQYYIERYFQRGSSRQMPDTPLQRVRKHLTTFRHDTGREAKG